ncbi:hypothetical protein ACIBG6_04325 [Streptomyces sp. NPDC050842]|uniref:hypothetical protein n=1 Tax=Streptomyces sp. NPDC050842 TaxID=3365636 RepID=UPI003788CA14
MARTARQLTALLPAILCALWSLLLLQTPSAQAAPVPVTAYSGAVHHTAPDGAVHHTAPDGAVHHTAPDGAGHLTARSEAGHLATSPETHLAPDAVAELPAAVEHSVRFPAPPATPAAAVADLSVPARGVLAGSPHRERAPPGDRHEPRDSRGPPSPRHS